MSGYGFIEQPSYSVPCSTGDRAEFVHSLKTLIGVDPGPIESNTGPIQHDAAADGTKVLRYAIHLDLKISVLLELVISSILVKRFR